MILYSFHPDAEAEFAAAALFYKSRVAGLGRSFSAEVQRTISLIREYPDAGALVRPGPLAKRWSIGFRMQWSTGTIQSRSSFSPSRTRDGGRVTGSVASSAPTLRSTGRAGTRLELRRASRRRAGYLQR